MTNSLRVAAALAWESWMLLRWGLMTRLGLALTFVVLFSALSIYDPTPSDAESVGLKASIMFVAMVAVISGLTMGVGREGKPGFPYTLSFTSPAPTWLSVTIPLY